MLLDRITMKLGLHWMGGDRAENLDGIQHSDVDENMLWTILREVCNSGQTRTTSWWCYRDGK
jgi:hypothetical protein